MGTETMLDKLAWRVRTLETNLAAHGPLADISDAERIECLARTWGLQVRDATFRLDEDEAIERICEQLSLIAESCDPERLMRLAWLRQELAANGDPVDRRRLLAAEAAGIDQTIFI